MKSIGLIGAVVAFIISGVWFLTHQMKVNSDEYIKKTIVKKDTNKTDATNYARLVKKQKERLENEEKLIKKDSTSEEANGIEGAFDIDKALTENNIEENKTNTEVENNITNDNLSFNLNKWELLGSNKDILVIGYNITNNSDSTIEKIAILLCNCKSYDNKLLDKITKEISLKVYPNQKYIKKGLIIGRTNPSTEKVECFLNTDIEEKNKSEEPKKVNKADGDKILDLLGNDD